MGWTKAYAEPIGSAFVGFLLVSAILALPYLAWQYRRRGTLTAARMWAQTSLVLYLMCAWALVLMPFPDDPCQRVVQPQLDPLNWLELARSGSVGGRGLLLNPNTVMFVFNIALLFPWGVYLRRWFGRGFLSTAALGLGMSLAFEVTQYTAVFGLFECTYRQFNVDDLMANTGGAILGWLVAPLVFIVPRKGEEAQPPDRVTVPRRTLAFVLDFAITLGATFAYTLMASQWNWPIPPTPFYIAMALTCWLLPLATNGRTPGQFSVGIRTTHGRNPLRQFVRFTVVWCWYPLFSWLLAFSATYSQTSPRLLTLIAAAGVAMWPLVLLTGIHERLSGTRAIPDMQISRSTGSPSLGTDPTR